MSRVRYEPCPKCREKGKDNRGDNLCVWANGGYHCFSCGNHKTAGVSSVWAIEKVDHGSAVLPRDFTREVPAAAWKWLLQYGLSYRYWKPHVGWSEADSRLVFTVGTPTEFSIGRFIDDRHGEVQSGLAPQAGRTEESVVLDSPKERQPRKWFCYGNAHRTPHLFRPGEGTDVRRDQTASTRVILVEDLISAHKVGQLQSCIPLFGVRVFDSIIPVLRHLRLPITFWLDSDQQGTVQRKAANLSILTGLPVSYVFTDNDPKQYSLDQIEETLND